MIVLTSNLGSRVSGGPARRRAGRRDAREQVMDVVRAAFRPGVPEPARRGDPVQPARPGADEGHRRDPARAPAQAAGRPAHGARAHRARARAGWRNAGYDPVYGARPLKRVIQRALQDPLALMLLEGRLARRRDGAGRRRRGRPGDPGHAGRGCRLSRAVRAAGPPAASSADRAPPAAAALPVDLGAARREPCAGRRPAAARPPASVDAQRVDLAAVCQQLVVEVRPGREAGGADIADHLALLDPPAGPRCPGANRDRWA